VQLAAEEAPRRLQALSVERELAEGDGEVVLRPGGGRRRREWTRRDLLRPFLLGSDRPSRWNLELITDADGVRIGFEPWVAESSAVNVIPRRFAIVESVSPRVTVYMVNGDLRSCARITSQRHRSFIQTVSYLCREWTIWGQLLTVARAEGTLPASTPEIALATRD